MMRAFQREVASTSLNIETGQLAQLANGSVLLKYGDSVILVTATMAPPRAGVDFLPLTVDFEERHYARGKIPGSFFRREGRPSTEAILIDRLTDRPLRPLFPKGFRNEVQIIATPFSTDMEQPLDILTVVGASAALTISDIPFDGPIGATRVGFIDGQFIINPTYDEIAKGDLDLVVAGSRHGVMMMEAAASEVSETVFLEAIQRAQEVNLDLVTLQDEMAREIGKDKASFESFAYPEELDEKINTILGDRLTDALNTPGDDKSARSNATDALRSELIENLGEEYSTAHISEAFHETENVAFRKHVLATSQRPDGRDLTEIRPLDCDTGLLPRTHGSSLFTRGETQILGVVTLGGPGDAQRLDTLGPSDSKRFMLHYNFPPYSTGEAGRVGSPKRRDIGHGALAERALLPMIPSEEEFPYAVRIVCEALSSNGSTSMGSVCAGTMALMDAGVPIKSPVAGISIGLIAEEGGKFVTMTDIMGLEDHAGHMDFKVAGTREGITAIQLDIKVKNISMDIIEAAMKQAKEARFVLLDRMAQAISAPRTEMSPYAPKMTSIKVPVDKIGAVIGPGGKTIRSIVEETGATVDVQDDGTVVIGASEQSAANKAIDIIEGLTKEAKIGDIYTGKVVRILNFGAFVQILPGKDGMVHISELSDHRVPSVEDVVSLGDEITVIVKDIDASGRIALSRRMLLEGTTPSDSVGNKSDDNPSGSRGSSRDTGRTGGNGGRYNRGSHRSRGG
ncbi:polyribonucleotide nucleotidyltransferase [Dehalococcoidia bacterium]|nr:polyribonucleotide nucleotidyltransferase [Dehalococcoidia bacterium]